MYFFSSFHLFILCRFKRKQNCQNICLICILLHAQSDAMFTYSKNFKWAVEEICVYFVAVACCGQSPSNKVLWRALFMKQNLTFWLLWSFWQLASVYIFCADLGVCESLGFLRRPKNLKKSSSYFWQEQQRTFQKVDEDFSKQMWTSCIIQTLLILLNWSYGGADKCRILFHKKSLSQDFFRGTLAVASNCNRIQRFPG